MLEDSHPDSHSVRQTNRWIEHRVMRACRCAVFTAPGAMGVYQKRYPLRNKSSFRLIENGYDNVMFAEAENLPNIENSALNQRILKVVHSGTIYRLERDPTSFFDALAILRNKGLINEKEIQFILRDSDYVDEYQALLRERNIQEMVKLAPPISYREALSEMLNSDALLILQASSCNRQIPAKLYEYLRAKRPILALTDPEGDTAWVLRRAGINSIASLDSVEDISSILIHFIEMLRNRTAPKPEEQEIINASRKSRTQQLSQLFDEIVNMPSENVG
jgi:hypothetical protein